MCAITGKGAERRDEARQTIHRKRSTAEHVEAEQTTGGLLRRQSSSQTLKRYQRVYRAVGCSQTKIAILSVDIRMNPMIRNVQVNLWMRQK
jgi:hypothetical protein